MTPEVFINQFRTNIRQWRRDGYLLFTFLTPCTKTEGGIIKLAYKTHNTETRELVVKSLHTKKLNSNALKAHRLTQAQLDQALSWERLIAEMLSTVGEVRHVLSDASEEANRMFQSVKLLHNKTVILPPVKDVIAPLSMILLHQERTGTTPAAAQAFLLRLFKRFPLTRPDDRFELPLTRMRFIDALLKNINVDEALNNEFVWEASSKEAQGWGHGRIN